MGHFWPRALDKAAPTTAWARALAMATSAALPVARTRSPAFASWLSLAVSIAAFSVASLVE